MPCSCGRDHTIPAQWDSVASEAQPEEGTSALAVR